MAHKKGMGSSRNGRESESKRLGVKLFGGQTAIAGNIIIRQRGTKFHPGAGVGLGRDHTIFATIDGKVHFRTKANNRTYVSVLGEEDYAAARAFANGQSSVKAAVAAPAAAPAPAKAETKSEEAPAASEEE